MFRVKGCLGFRVTGCLGCLRAYLDPENLTILRTCSRKLNKEP